MINQENTVSREHHTLTLTYCGVSHECLPVGHHGVNRHLLEVLAGDDGDGRLLGGLHLRHLLHHGDLLLVGLGPGEAVQVVLQRLDLLVQLQLRDEDPDLRLGAAREAGAESLQGDGVGVGLLDLLQHGSLAGFRLRLDLRAN